MIRTVGPNPDWTYALSNAPPEDNLDRTGPSTIEPAPGRGGVSAGQRRGGGWTITRSGVGVGWHHPRDALLSGPLVLDPRTRSDGGEKTPAVTVAQMRSIFTELLRKRRPHGTGDRRSSESSFAA